jgi:hypothetical protein
MFSLLFKRLTIILCIIFLAGCFKKQQVPPSHQKTQLQDNAGNIELQIKNFKPQIKIHKIGKLTIKSFLDITISQMEQQVLFFQRFLKQGFISAEETQDTENGDNKKFISLQEKERSQFFSKWGISDNDFAQFGINHSQEIQSYIATNTDVKNRIDALQNFLIKIQEGSSDENDEYNTKDADAIVSNTPNG